MNTSFAVSSNTWQKLRAKATYLTLKLKVECQTNPPLDKWNALPEIAENSDCSKFKSAAEPLVKYELQNV